MDILGSGSIAMALLRSRNAQEPNFRTQVCILLRISLVVSVADCSIPRPVRTEAEHMFYHGFDNYMKYAYPEDELRPLSCAPLTRDRENPAHIELNDVLGNYSLTLVDSLSTLAILSDASSQSRSGRKAWSYFQDGVQRLVDLYGDGSNDPRGIGSRGKGFDVDSKVQVFETVIRGVGKEIAPCTVRYVDAAICLLVD